MDCLAIIEFAHIVLFFVIISSVFSVILANGSYRSFANDRSLEMHWNATRNSFVVQFARDNKLLIDEPIYAATCAYIPDDGE